MDSLEKIQNAFLNHLQAESTSGSKKPASYIRAITLLEDILPRKAPLEFQIADIWRLQSPNIIRALYEFVLINQRLGENGIFALA